MSTTPTYASEMIRITTYITREQDDSLNTLTESTGRKKSELIRESINSFTTKLDSEAGIEDMDAYLEEFQSGFSKYTKPTFQQFSERSIQTQLESYIKPFQANLCDRLVTYSRLIICAPRQCGLTTMLSMFAAYRASTKPCKIIFGVFRELCNSQIRDLITQHLAGMKGVSIVTTNKSSIVLSNKSTIEIMSFASKAFTDALGDVTNEFILDEFAFAKPSTQMEMIADKLIQNCKIPHFKLFVGSTPTSAIRYSDDGYPILTHFYRLWAFAMATDSPLRAIQIPREAMGCPDIIHTYDPATESGKRRTLNEVDGTFSETNSDAFIDVIEMEVIDE